VQYFDNFGSPLIISGRISLKSILRNIFYAQLHIYIYNLVKFRPRFFKKAEFMDGFHKCLKSSKKTQIIKKYTQKTKDKFTWTTG
jgi:hypothetical protein